MRGTACDEICALIDSEAIGWSNPERLRVEQHLGECPSCSESLSLSRFVRATLKEAAGELSEGARSRAIRNALSVSAQKKPRVRVEKTWSRWGIGLGLAAAAAVALWVVRTPAPETAALVKKPAVVAPAAKTASLDEKPASSEAKKDEPSVVESKERETHTFAHATVAFSPATRTRFDAATRTLSLEQGAIDVDVDPAKGESFNVTTQQFRVEVLGTRFSVTPDAVTVQQGRVRVLDPNGVVLASALGAGETFSVAKNTRAASKPTPKVSAANAKALLAEARSALYRYDAPAARSLVQQAEHAHPGRGDRAEAGTLRAEILLLERDHVAAVRAYREVATQYAELPAGENAAFAAAQLALKAEPTKARALLDAYLARYPKGRFVNEVQERLRRLDAR
jgi:hypothetical protein